MGNYNYLEILSRFKKPNLPPTWNGLFTLIFQSFSKRVTGSDSASKLFLTILYGVYSGINLDYGLVLWAQLVQSTISVTRHLHISCACFWAIIVQKKIDHHNILVIEGSVIATIPIFHTSNVIVSDSSRFTFIGSIAESMLRNVPADSEVIKEYRRQPASSPHRLTAKM